MADLVKRAARQAIAAAARATRLWPPVPRGCGLVLRYHRIGECGLGVPAAEFDAQLGFLAARARVLTAGQMAAAVAAGEPLPPNAVAITFDDGYEDNASRALPLLQRHGLRATFFVTTGWIGTEKVLWWDRLHDYVRQALAAGARPLDFEGLPPPMAEALAAANLLAPADAARLEHALLAALRGISLTPEETDTLVERVAAALGADVADPEPCRPMSWDQVRALRDAGMEVGSHTVSHARLASVPPERAFEELEQSKQALERELGASPSLVACPGGECNQDAVDLIQEAGYSAAFTTESGPVRPGDDVFRLRRVGVWAGGYRGVFSAFSASVFGLQLGRLARHPAGTHPAGSQPAGGCGSGNA
ncbi:MAG TPA: polysaccharide deacetylase family protein [Planctomycetota bacterium]|nr:polysaccharide deacetylase family protein [Planctomycetota bacterium]HRR78862.1 polysaccharide deacetylase family protein [Planctomycetota bacterium]HRT92832.1 polysaccharide deacetylase family protein [Planctomycetota bacterium]